MEGLIDTRNEYIEHIQDIIAIPLSKRIYEIWCDCSKIKGSIKEFQKELIQIKKWNNNIIYEEYKKIIKKTKCKYLPDLIKMIIITTIKIKIYEYKDQFNNIKIKIPLAEDFIHKCYINISIFSWKNAYLFNNKNIKDSEYQNNLNIIEENIRIIIKKTFRDFIPFDDIFQQIQENIEDIDNAESDIRKTKSSKKGKSEKSSTTKARSHEDAKEESDEEPEDAKEESEEEPEDAKEESEEDPEDAKEESEEEPEDAKEESEEEPEEEPVKSTNSIIVKQETKKDQNNEEGDNSKYLKDNEYKGDDKATKDKEESKQKDGKDRDYKKAEANADNEVDDKDDEDEEDDKDDEDEEDDKDDEDEEDEEGDEEDEEGDEEDEEGEEGDEDEEDEDDDEEDEDDDDDEEEEDEDEDDEDDDEDEEDEREKNRYGVKNGGNIITITNSTDDNEYTTEIYKKGGFLYSKNNKEEAENTLLPINIAQRANYENNLLQKKETYENIERKLSVEKDIGTGKNSEIKEIVINSDNNVKNNKLRFF